MDTDRIIAQHHKHTLESEMRKKSHAIRSHLERRLHVHAMCLGLQLERDFVPEPIPFCQFPCLACVVREVRAVKTRGKERRLYASEAGLPKDIDGLRADLPCARGAVQSVASTMTLLVTRLHGPEQVPR